MKYKLSIYIKNVKHPLVVIVPSKEHIDKFYALLENGTEHSCVHFSQIIFDKANFHYATYEPFEEKKKFLKKC